jgi:hypothetical protein
MKFERTPEYDGVHSAEITAVRRESEPYEYLQVEFETDRGETFEIGYPWVESATQRSALGRLFQRFGVFEELLDRGELTNSDVMHVARRVLVQDTDTVVVEPREEESKFVDWNRESLRPE